jgi:hypothetical protein
MTTFLINHLFHESERLSASEQLRLARMLIDRIRVAEAGPASSNRPAANTTEVRPGRNDRLGQSGND